MTQQGRRIIYQGKITKPLPLRPLGKDDAPHCRHHIVFRSDCEQCRSAREYG